jgi:ankyrin repeat protein
MYAARFGRREIVAYLCAQNAEVNRVRNLPPRGFSSNPMPYLDIEGGTALMECALHGDTGIARILLEHGADVHAVSSLGNTALIYAAQEGNAALVALLLAKSADPRKANRLDETALSYAVRANRIDVVNRLLEDSLSLSPIALAGALCAAVDSDDVYLAERLIRTGIRTDTVIDLWGRGKTTPFIYAARQGKVGLLRLFLKSGIEINRIVESGSALSAAAAAGQSEAIRFLLDHGADADIASYSIRAPFALALEKGNAEAVWQFLAHGTGGKTRRFTASGKIPLYSDPKVFKLALPEIAERLRDNLSADSIKAAVYAALPPAFTAPYQPVANLGMLLGMGLEFDFEKLGVTRLMALAAAGKIEAMESEIGEDNSRNMLREVNLNMAKGNGMTALKYAISAGQRDAVKLLVESGAEIKSPSPEYNPGYGRNISLPLEFAFFYGDSGTIGYLMEKGARMPRSSLAELPGYDYYNHNVRPGRYSKAPDNMPTLLALELGGFLDLFYQEAARNDTALKAIDYQVAFLIAAVKGYREVAEYLLKNHPELAADLFKLAPGSDFSMGSTAFVAAAEYGQESILRLMAQAVRPPDGWSTVLSEALLAAERHGNRKSAEFLLQLAFGISGRPGAD